jgi:glycosyltransferase involved in cell wall biosynthesis
MLILFGSAIIPKISVVLSVFNGGDFLSRSIESILFQTLNDFEFIIINDGSKDNSLQIIKKYARQDKRIIVVNQEKNIGLTKCLNIGCDISKGKYIARHDADDISMNNRLEKQFNFLEKRKDVVLLGSMFFEINNERKVISKYFDENLIIKKLKLQNPLIHSSAFIRSEIFRKIGFYNELYKTSQDYDAWLRIASYGNIVMLNEPLVDYYVNQNSISNKYRLFQCFNSIKIRWHHRKYIGLKYFFIGSVYRLLAAYTPKIIVNIKRHFFIRCMR